MPTDITHVIRIACGFTSSFYRESLSVAMPRRSNSIRIKQLAAHGADFMSAAIMRAICFHVYYPLT